MQEEIWKPIQGYEGLYEVSNLGQVKSLKRSVKHSKRGMRATPCKLLKPSITKTGYPNVSLCKDGVVAYKSIHRLVAQAFIPNPCGLPQVNHKDGNRANNLLSNLEWVSVSQNVQHGFDSLNRKCYNSIRVECVETGEVFDSISSAERKMGLYGNSIRRIITHNSKSNRAGGYTWRKL